MTRGKHICKILKDIRREIAEANGIELVTSECRYKGNCPGTCPKCEAEVRYLEEQLRARQFSGKILNIAGLSVGAVAMLSPFAIQSQTAHPSPTQNLTENISEDTIIVKGTVFDGDGSQTEPLAGATIHRLGSSMGTLSDIDGNFQIVVYKGDVLRFSYIGFESDTITINDSTPVKVTLQPIEMSTEDMMIRTIGAIVRHKYENLLEIRVVDEDNKPLNFRDVTLERIWNDEDGDENCDYIYADKDEENGLFRIFWNENKGFADEANNVIREATLRITAEGYRQPKIIHVNYPESNILETVKFMSEQE